MDPSPVEILLVDDNPNDVELALHALKKHRLVSAIQVVRDGAEALDFLFRTGAYSGRKAGNPRVVLLDLKLPKVDGLEVLRRLRADLTCARTPVVVLTSSNQECDLAQAYTLGANSYIVKPVDWAQFTEAVRQLGMYWLVLNEPPPTGSDGPREREQAGPTGAGQ